MKKIYYCMLLCLGFAQYASAQCAVNTPLGSTVNTWDWRTQTYNFYFASLSGTPVLYSQNSPFFAVNQQSQPNVSVFQIPIFKDYEPEDGWELLIKDFGTPAQGAEAAYFALYNRYESRIRLFILVPYKGLNQTATINISFKKIVNPDGNAYQSALFEHLNGTSNAVEKQVTGINLSVPNAYNNANYTWFHADIPVAYDPCTCGKQTQIFIEPKLATISSITLKMQGSGTIVQQIVQNNTIVAAAPLKYVLIPAVNKGTEVFNTVKEAEVKIGTTIAQLDNVPVLSDLGNLLDQLPDWVVNSVPYLGAAIGVLDFLTAGGKKKEAPPSPAIYNTTTKFEASGSITTTNQYPSYMFYTPGCNQVGLLPALAPIYNNILGTFNLLDQPAVYVATETADYNYRTASPNTKEEAEYVQNDTIMDKGGNTTFSPLDGGNTSTRTYYRYQLKNDISYVINPASALSQTPVGVQGALFFTFPPPVAPCALDVSTTLIRVFSVIGSSSVTYRTPYMPLGCLKDFVAEWSAKRQGYGYCYSNAPTVSIQVIATLKRDPALDPYPNPAANEVLFAAKYNVTLDVTSKTYAQMTPPAYLSAVPIDRTVQNINITTNTTLYAWNTITIGSGVTVAAGVTLTLVAGGEINLSASSLPTGVVLQIGLPVSGGTQCDRVLPAKEAAYIGVFCSNIAKYNPTIPKIANEDEMAITEDGGYSLGVFPNPASQSFTATIGLLENSDIVLSLSNVLGQKIENLRFQGLLSQGKTSIPLDISELGSGVYFLSLQTSNGVLKTQKIVKP